MSGRPCAKEEICCRKARCMIEAHEKNLKDGNYDDADDPEALRVEIRNIIDKFAGKLERRMLEYTDGA